jgi:predicted Zn-dependent peptidase
MIFIMNIQKLKNGMTIIQENKEGNSVVLQICVNVGSNHETEQLKGVSHLIEHMLFEGTIKRKDNQKITEDIEKVGGEFNAFTTNERTCFYIKVLKKDFELALDVLADIILNSQFNPVHFKKEKTVVLREIEMVEDEPRLYQWSYFLNKLFHKHPALHPIYGYKKIIKKINRDQAYERYKETFVGSNISLSVIGNVKGWKEKVNNKFKDLPKGKVNKNITINEGLIKKNKVFKKKIKSTSTYSILGFKTVPITNKDCFVLEIIDGILGKGQSGKIFAEVRSKRGLGYDVGTQNINEISFGYFAIYFTTTKENISKAKDIILEEIKKLKNVTEKDLKESKTFKEGEFLLDLENSLKIADQILYWNQATNPKDVNNYIKNLKKVTTKDVQRVIKKYFNNHALVILEGCN